MTDVLPTTVHELEANDRSPCCDAQLVLVSPPDGYECRECYERYGLGASDESEAEEAEDEDEADEPETCQEVIETGDRAGEVCGRERPCRFHD